jgi:hypothetical protein
MTVTHRKIVQAKHIPDDLILREVERLNNEYGCWAMTCWVAEAMPGMPPAVVAAKLSRLMHRGMVTGCDCGCRGDWELTAKGREHAGITDPPRRPNPME